MKHKYLYLDKPWDSFVSFCIQSNAHISAWAFYSYWGKPLRINELRMWHAEKITRKIPSQSSKMQFIQSDGFVTYNLTIYIHKEQKKQRLHVRAQKRTLPLSVIWRYSRKRHWSSSECRRQASYFKLRIRITASAWNVHPCESHMGPAEDFRNKGEPGEEGLCQLWNRSEGSPLAVGVRGSPGSEGELLREAAAHPAQGAPSLEGWNNKNSLSASGSSQSQQTPWNRWRTAESFLREDNAWCGLQKWQCVSDVLHS